MPELPEVETVRIGLQKRFRRKTIVKIEVLKERTIASEGGSSLFIKKIQNKKISNWERRGKYLIGQLINPSKKFDGWITVHLRMTGYFKVLKKEIPLCPHTRVRFWDQTGNEIRFIDVRNFGQLWYTPQNSSPNTAIKGISKLGPEPLSKNFNNEYLSIKLKAKKRTIKSALLDQELIAGIGNIYADESLFDAGINPQRECRSINDMEIKNLCSSIKKILEISIGEGGTTFSDFRNLEGLNGNYGGQAKVYRRTNMPCKVCGKKIKRIKISGRSTHWCEKCQT